MPARRGLLPPSPRPPGVYGVAGAAALAEIARRRAAAALAAEHESPQQLDNERRGERDREVGKDLRHPRRFRLELDRLGRRRDLRFERGAGRGL
jgi:hypothetical protein